MKVLEQLIIKIRKKSFIYKITKYNSFIGIISFLIINVKLIVYG